MDVLLGTTDLANTPLGQSLESQRLDLNDIVSARAFEYLTDLDYIKISVESTIIKLRKDLETSFEQLSEEAIEAFTTDRQPGTGYADLSEEQIATVRFRDIRRHMVQSLDVARFIDIQHFIKRTEHEAIDLFDDSTEVWTAASDGAAVPRLVEDVISPIVMEAVLKPELKVSAEELRLLLHQNRRQLLALAAYNIQDLFKSDGKKPTELKRDEQGQLQVLANYRPGLKIRQKFTLR